MASTPRRPSLTGIHHVMNRGVDHQTVFFGDADRIEFGRRLAAIHDERDVTTLAYSLMGNHFHLLLRSPPDALSDAMQHLTSVYTRHTNDRVGRDGPLFRGRFHSIPVESDSYLMWVSRYIHRNPLSIGGVDAPADYRWSSYRAYVGHRPAPHFLDIAPVLALFGGRREALVAFTEDGGGTGGCARLATDDIRLLVDCAIAVDDLTHDVGDAARQRLRRTVMVLLAAPADDPRLRRALEAELGARSDRAADAALRRASHRLASDPAVRRILAWVDARIASEVIRVGRA